MANWLTASEVRQTGWYWWLPRDEMGGFTPVVCNVDEVDAGGAASVFVAAGYSYTRDHIRGDLFCGPIPQPDPPGAEIPKWGRAES